MVMIQRYFTIKHYDSEGYVVTKINGENYKATGSWETLANAIRSTEKIKEQFE